MTTTTRTKAVPDRYLTPADLDLMNDDEFRRRVVDADLRRNSPNKKIRTELPQAVHDALRTTHLDRWYRTLSATRYSVEGQIAVRTRELNGRLAHLDSQLARLGSDDPRRAALESEKGKAHADFENAMAKSERFRSGLDADLLEARSLIGAGGDTVRFQELVNAVMRHKARVEAGDEDDEAIDLELWATAQRLAGGPA